MKRNIGQKFLAVIIVFSVLGVAAGCGVKSGEKANLPDTGTIIRVGYFPNLTHAQALVGFNDGTFQKALGSGVKLEERIFNAGPAEIEALLAGEIDLGYIGPVPAVNGFVKSKGGLRIIAGAADAGAVLLAGKGSGIRNVSDLRGKKVAVPQLGNTQDISLRNLLAGANLKDAAKGGDVTIIPAENPDILTLMAKGDIDAALVPEPWGSRIVKQAGAGIVLDASQVWRGGQYTTAVVIASSKFLKESPDLAEKWLEAHVDLTQRMNADKENSKRLANAQIEKLTKKSLPGDILSSSFDRIGVTYNPESDSVRDFVKLSVDNGYLKQIPEVTNLFDLTILNKVLEKNGLPTVK
ncbi:MAG: aliphatic sulfonate ABC transporter substrate-binding protein [Thermincola sp.]|jgi:NitT/TauT family transport system substrate-binding protein|nr:aliphatic sulfonate ABC transporter substrate-binding protein [Thermincola sp.]MDT3704944.1 aliphatic sulfonate ABC transporter substrate-binding protein [Thermincola sp.]